jgi:hypothetical protein
VKWLPSSGEWSSATGGSGASLDSGNLLLLSAALRSTGTEQGQTQGLDDGCEADGQIARGLLADPPILYRPMSLARCSLGSLLSQLADQDILPVLATSGSDSTVLLVGSRPGPKGRFCVEKTNPQASPEAPPMNGASEGFVIYAEGNRGQEVVPSEGNVAEYRDI